MASKNSKFGFIRSVKNRFGSLFASAKNKYYPKTKTFIKKRPMTSFFIVLGLLFGLILLNSILTPAPATTLEEATTQEVEVYRIGTAPKVSFSGVVEKEGVVQIVAQTAGIVNSVNVVVGQEVARGTVLINLANNYTGGNAPGVQAGIASAQYNNIKKTYDTQKKIIEKQREVARKTDENADELRDITDESIGATRSVVELNDDIISTIEDDLEELKNNNPGGVNDDAILSTQQLLGQVKSGNNQLIQSLRNSEYQSEGDNPPAELSDLQREITLKQLDVQEKSLKLSKEVSRLQAAVAYINASAMSPASPFYGVVERVNVVPGQNVNPGTVLATVTSKSQKASIVVKVPKRIAENVSKVEESTLFISGKTYPASPIYISSEATDGLLHSIIYAVPEDLVGKLTDRDFIQIDIPIGYPDAISAIPYLPIDVIYQTQNSAYIYVVQDGKVVAKDVVLGEVVGGTVAITEGLVDQDLIILDRNVIEGEEVVITN